MARLRVVLVALGISSSVGVLAVAVLRPVRLRLSASAVVVREAERLCAWPANAKTKRERKTAGENLRRRRPRARPATLRQQDDQQGRFSPTAWEETRWDDFDVFDRIVFLRGLLDGSASEELVNHAVWRGLALVPERICSGDTPAPDVFRDGTFLATLEAVVPCGGDIDRCETADDEDELGMYETVIDTLHGEELTKSLIEAADPGFMARRAVVLWLLVTQPELAL